MKAMTDGAILARLCGNVTAGRFDWRKYCTPQTYFGREVCVTPLLCSYGQIGYAVHFPYSDMPEVEYDWELNSLTIDGEEWRIYFSILSIYREISYTTMANRFIQTTIAILEQFSPFSFISIS